MGEPFKDNPQVDLGFLIACLSLLLQVMEYWTAVGR
jgi:hypothetical protein